MFPKLLKNAKLEDVQKENPTLLAEIKESLKAEVESSVSASFSDKITEAETSLAIVAAEKEILMHGIQNKQGDLAVTLVNEGKSKIDAVAAIDAAKSSLDHFEQSAPDAAGSGSAADSQAIDTKEKAIDFIMKSNNGMTRAKAIGIARRQFSSLFVNPTLLNHTGKRS